MQKIDLIYDYILIPNFKILNRSFLEKYTLRDA